MTTREDEAHDRLLFSVRVPPDPSRVGHVRRRLGESLSTAGRDDLVDDACLVVSELVTNALLHAGGEIAVTASYDDRRLLVQVSDGSPHVPLPRGYGDGARTGRGLLLVESMSDDWGFLRHAHGKTVWVRWSRHDDVRAHGETALGHGDQRTPTVGDTVEVTLLEFPRLLHAAWRMHIRALLRDHLLASLTSEDDEIEAVVTHAEVTDAISVLDEHLPLWDPDVALAASIEPEVTLAKVVLPVPRHSVAHFTTLDRAIDSALQMAQDGRLLTPGTLPEVREFRRWVSDQVRRQAAGHPPTPYAVPVDDPVPVHPPDGWDPDAVTLSPLSLLASNTRGRIVALSRAAVSLLGYDDPSELIGRRLVAIVPPRLRQAHVTGLTMYILTDHRPLIDTLITVPAVRRDETEILVDLLIREQPTADDRPMLVAEITAHEPVATADPPGPA